MISISSLKIDDKSRLTVQQKNAIEQEGKIIVSASAGAGKTSTMVLKILALIANGKHLKDMLIVVYNDAAAAELKQKLIAKLSEMISDDSVDEIASMRCREEIRDIEFCQISTIHAFCRTLVKENFQELGISPQFEIIDDQKNSQLMNNALDNVFAGFLEDDSTFNDLLEIFSERRKDDNIKNNLIGLFETYNIQPNKEEFLTQINRCFDCEYYDSFYVNFLYKYYVDLFESLLTFLKEIQNKLTNSVQITYLNKCNYLIERCEYLLRCNNFKSLIVAANNYPEYDGKNPKIIKSDPDIAKNEKPVNLLKTISKQLDSFVDNLSDYLKKEDTYIWAHKQNKKYIDKIIEIIKNFENEYRKLKDEENEYTFDDLLHFTIEIINNKNGGLDKYEYVFVDEYQDVTPLTEYITSYFIDKNSFLVGDVKQSIYGFNLADPTIFLKRQKEYENNGDISIGFNRNFRSRKNILSFVNDVFSSIMTIKSADIDYKHNAMFDIDDAKNGGEVEINIITNSTSDKSSDSDDTVTSDEVQMDEVYDIRKDSSVEEESISKAYYEGKFIANKINSLVNEVNYIHDENDNPRRINYSDIVILFRGRNAANAKIIEAIKEENIPIDASSFSISKSNAEQEIMSLLRIIDNPMQDNYLIGFLLSFFGKYSEDDLAEISLNNKGDSFYEKFINASNKNDKLAYKIKETLTMLDSYRVKASFKNVSDLMNGIISDFSYDAYLMHNGSSEVNTLKSFIINQVKRKSDSLNEFINEYSGNEKTVSLVSESESVKVSTFHAYKGLESPIVFIADITQLFNKMDTRKDLLYMGNGNLAMKSFDIEKKNKYNSVSYSSLSTMIAQKNQKEEMRLLYVALTRAKEKLFISGSKQIKDDIQNLLDAKSNFDFLQQAAYFSNGKLRINKIEFNTEKGAPIADSNDKIDEKIINAIKDAQKFEYKHKLETKLGIKYGVSSLISDNDGVPFMYESKADIGTIYHKVMQNINFETKTMRDVDKEFDRFISSNLLTQDELKLVEKDLILRCLQTDFIKKACDAEKFGKALREQKFMMYIEANKVSELKEFQTDEKVLVQGIVDLFIDGEESILVDFKYSNLSDYAIVEKYKKQLRLYKIALENKNNKKIDKILLYSFKTGKEIIVDF